MSPTEPAERSVHAGTSRPRTQELSTGPRAGSTRAPRRRETHAALIATLSRTHPPDAGLSCGEPPYPNQDVLGDAHSVLSIRLDNYVLDLLRIHLRRELDGSVEIPFHPATRSSLTHTRLERFGRRAKAHNEDVGAGYSLPKAVELGARLKDTRDEQPARTRALVVLP